MNRTLTFLASAALLGLLALVIGLPQKTLRPTPAPVATPPSLPPAPPAPVPTPAVRTDGSIRMESRLSHPYVGVGRSDAFVTVDLTGVQVPGARTPVNLALVIDRSGSMNGVKLQRAKAAAQLLVNQLGEADRLAIVHYGSDVRALPSMIADHENRVRMVRFINGIWDDGGTNIGAGLKTGQKQLAAALSEYKVNRLILISDGQPTEGMTSERALTQLVQNIRASGVSVSAIGVGTDFNEDLMQAIAELGAGSYGYIRDTTALPWLFQKDLQQASTMIARNVTLSFQLPPGSRLGEVLGYRFTRVGDTIEVPLPDFSSGQVEKVVMRVSLEAASAGQSIDVASLKLAYRDLVADADVRSDAQLVAHVTHRREEVLARRDKNATVTAVRAQTAANFQAAAGLLSKGQRAEAQRVLRENEKLYDFADQVAGAPAMAADRGENAALGLSVGGAGGGEALSDAVKQLKVKALRSSGRGSSVY